MGEVLKVVNIRIVFKRRFQLLDAGSEGVITGGVHDLKRVNVRHTDLVAGHAAIHDGEAQRGDCEQPFRSVLWFHAASCAALRCACIHSISRSANSQTWLRNSFSCPVSSAAISDSRTPCAANSPHASATSAVSFSVLMKFRLICASISFPLSPSPFAWGR